MVPAPAASPDIWILRPTPDLYIRHLGWGAQILQGNFCAHIFPAPTPITDLGGKREEEKYQMNIKMDIAG